MFVIGIKTLLSTDEKDKSIASNRYYPCLTGEKWGVINGKGEFVIEPTFDEMITVPDSKNDIFICMQEVNYETGSYRVKVLNSKKKEILTDYDIVEAIENTDESYNMWYEEGVLRVKKPEGYGLVSLLGKELLKPEYQSITALPGTKNSFILEKEDKVGLCDNKGKIIVPVEYKEIKSIENDYKKGYIVKNTDGNYGVIDFNAKVILEPKYEDIQRVSGNKTYVVKQDGKWKLVNEKQEVLLEDKFEQVATIEEDKLIIVKDNQYGVLGISGEEIIAPQYEALKIAFGDYYIAKKNGKYGVISATGEEKIAFEYANISYQTETDFIIADKANGTEQDLFDNKFQKKLTGIVSNIEPEKGYFRLYHNQNYDYYNFKFEKKAPNEVLTTNEIFLSKKDGKYGYVGKDGNVVVDYIYEDATELNQYGYASIKQNGKWGAIDQSGTLIAPPTYELQDNKVIDFIGKWHLSGDLNSYYYTDQ